MLYIFTLKENTAVPDCPGVTKQTKRGHAPTGNTPQKQAQKTPIRETFKDEVAGKR